MIQRRSGFTLIEAVLALVILAVAIPPMLWALREAHMTRANPILASQARWLATEKLEDVIADRHSDTRGYDYVIEANYPDEASVDDFPAFSRSVAIVETEADLTTETAGGGYKRITVTVSWTDAQTNARSLVIGTVVTDYN